MKYVLAIVFPPAALLLCGKPWQCVVNLAIYLISVPLTLMFGVGVFLWLLCVLHAMTECVDHDREKRELRAAHDELSPVMEEVALHHTPGRAA